MKKGGQFENNFKKSVPDDILYYRFKDGTANWEHNNIVRFQAKNVCDCMIYNGEELIFIELKNHKGKSIPIKCIRENQREELLRYSKYKNTKCVIVINFEDLEECYCLKIKDVDDFINKENRKSIPIEYCREVGIMVNMKKLINNYRYDIESMINDLK